MKLTNSDCEQSHYTATVVSLLYQMLECINKTYIISDTIRLAGLYKLQAKVISKGQKYDLKFKMLYVFLVDTGTMMQLDMNLALEKVEHLKSVIAQSCSIPPEKQVLLISGGESLDANETVCKYSMYVLQIFYERIMFQQ